MVSHEEYLYLYEYSVEGQEEGQTCEWFGYFKDRQEIEFYILFYSAPHIRTIDIKECKNGLKLREMYMPYKRSEWEKLYQRSFWTSNLDQD